MKMKINIAFFLAVVLLFLNFAGPMGCGDSNHPVKRPALQGDDSPFYGGFLKEVLEGLASGSLDEIGGDVMGLILDLMGFGGGSDQGDLNNMGKMLANLESKLNAVITDLNGLMVQLKIDTDKILLNTDNPSDAIVAIKVAHQTIYNYSCDDDPEHYDQTCQKPEDVGSIDQSVLENFCDSQERSNPTIYTQIDTIEYAISPDLATMSYSSVLDNFASLALDQGDSLNDSYLGLEKYFTQLLYYQMEGANVVVECKNFRTKANLPQPDGLDAKNWLDTFTANELKTETDKFMEVVYGMILGQVDLVDSTGFLPSGASDILSRADFLRIQALNQDHYGLRGTFMATRDLVNSVVAMSAKNHQTGQIYQGTGTLMTASGKPYDYWEGDKVKGSSDYTAISYDFGDVPLGDYDILDANGKVIGSATVQTYDDDYTVDSSGTIHYGHFVISERVGAKDAFNNNAAWVWGHKDLKNTGANGTASARFTGLEGDAEGDVFYGSDHLYANFRYEGKAGAGFTVHYSAHAYGKVSATGGSGGAEIDYTISLYDNTTQKEVHQLAHSEKGVNYFDEASIDDHPHGSWHFNDPTPGHDYYILFNCHTHGDVSNGGSAHGEITIDSIKNNVYLTF